MPQGRPEDYVRYEERDGIRYGITKDGAFHQVSKDAGTSSAKSESQVKSDLGYKAGGSTAATSEDEKYGKMSDDDIEKLPPLMKASAKARKKRYLAEEQAKALKK